ncbi:hypothetical protein JCM14244_16590 [Venenivibrio stagnispumantis]|uniref:Uncharacterized protein n=1 Tax=Venenivibrio stagnispumantis TaxID=407998 RepID=A0AA46AFQ7_9AQUI|nr:hypothetical protein [Venenivibrio stagnispumantis]MCW4573986.1 hypothetical protein [Venenivibrio stagnispumantis]SMP21061.1 hypothetical protein SAMN06264868_1223 [Venenivibrio stagnispumantis]
MVKQFSQFTMSLLAMVKDFYNEELSEDVLDKVEAFALDYGFAEKSLDSIIKVVRKDRFKPYDNPLVEYYLTFANGSYRFYLVIKVNKFYGVSVEPVNPYLLMQEPFFSVIRQSGFEFTLYNKKAFSVRNAIALNN